MCLTATEIERVANDPDLTYPADSRHGPNRQMRQKGRLCAVHGSDDIVITFLWSGNATQYAEWSRTAASTCDVEDLGEGSRLEE
jgi:hypothetical protein